MNLKISAERGDGMLNYLEQGMILYVMAAGFGVWGIWRI